MEIKYKKYRIINDNSYKRLLVGVFLLTNIFSGLCGQICLRFFFVNSQCLIPLLTGKTVGGAPKALGQSVLNIPKSRFAILESKL